MRIHAMRNLRAAPVLRASILSKDVTSFTRRQFNSQANDSEIFKVVDFNDIQNIIKRDGKVKYRNIYIHVCVTDAK